MPPRSNSLTPSRFQRRQPGGRHDLAFKVAFGGDGAAAKFFRVSRMTIWRWRHDRSPLPREVAKILERLVHEKVREAHDAEQGLRWFCDRPPPPPRKLSGCCATRQAPVEAGLPD
jgi:hypothetical protein